VIRAGGLVIATAALLSGGPVAADAWTQPKGQGQAILKFERMRADRGFDPSGDLADLPARRTDSTASVFTEYGLTDRLTLRLKGEWQSGADSFVDYDGRGPLEVGVNVQVWRDDRGALALYAGVADGGEGRNAGYAAPGVGDQDWEVRAAFGRSFAAFTQAGGWPTGTFVEVQAARRMRQGLPDETRMDATLGAHFGDQWMVLGQAFGGQTESGDARWLSLEASLVRRFGDWSIQAGWREAVAGREVPAAGGPVIALWRRF
jgi:protein XagA